MGAKTSPCSSRGLEEVGEIDRRTASSFVNEVLVPGRDGNTIHRMLSTYLQLFKYMKRDGIVEGENPFTDQGPPKQAQVKGVRRTGRVEP